MTVHTGQAAFVTLLQVQDGEATRLWPPPGQPPIRLDAQQWARFPDEHHRILVDGHTGNFSIFVIASQRPLSQAAPELAQLVDVTAATAPTPVSSIQVAPRQRRSARDRANSEGPASQSSQSDAQPAAAHQGRPLRERGLIVEHVRSDSADLVGNGDADGIAVLEFRVRHMAGERHALVER